ncbi:hypothetical protein ZIOFF_064969 [Zingiber officinale]|uniref:DUF4378 domain-containing protein n=2 Tax=Zingiber officinale TaxID=94328 RepID=A0A8J5K8M7_ZINOF|nr:hypothetical protein ZIOFF_064969 [Zingiber officinale]
MPALAFYLSSPFSRPRLRTLIPAQTRTNSLGDAVPRFNLAASLAFLHLTLGLREMGSEGGGFFHLFDWNRKSRKKLFYNGDACSEKTTKGNKCDYNKSEPQLHQVDQNESDGQASTEVGSNYYGNLVTDQEEGGFKAPGVVAKLMGLDSMPASSNSKPDSPLLDDSSSFWGNNSQKRDAEYYSNDSVYHVITRNNIYSGKIETKLQRMPSSPIEKFQIEMLPPRGAKTISITHHKLLSPVRNSGLIAPRNASYIIEAAAKILEPEFHSTTMGGLHSFRMPLKSLKDSESKGIIETRRNISKQIESSVGISKTGDPASLRGRTLKSSKSLKDDTGAQLNGSSNESQYSGAKVNQNSGSLPIKAKVNSQRKEGASLKSSTTLGKDNEGCSSNKPANSLLDDQNNNQDRRAPSVNGYSVLKRSNQKDKYPSGKGKLTLQPSVTEQQGTKNVIGHVSSEKRKIGSEFPVSNKVGYKKGIGTYYSEKEAVPSGCKNFSQHNSLVETKSSSQTSFSNGIAQVPPGKSWTLVQHNFVLDEHLKCRYDNVQKSTDVVSFTFTSQISKPKGSSLSFSSKVENQVKKNEYSDKKCQDVVYSDNQILPHSKQNVIEQDCLGILLERKLQDLTTGAQSPYFNLLKRGSVSACIPIVDDSASAFNEYSSERKKKASFSSVSLKSVSLASEMEEGNMSFRLQEMSRAGSHSKVDEIGHQDLSPLSWNSMLSCSSVHGNKISSTFCADLSNSVSQFSENRDGELVSEIRNGGHTNSSTHELEYVKEIIINTGFTFEDLIPCPLDHSFEILDPILFHKLEETRISTPNEAEEKRLRMRRKILFDSVNECLDRKCSQYFRSGFQSWVKGVAVAAKSLGDELYKEISDWSSIGDWMVDELVNRDMSTHLGGWVHYEIEAFEAGIEIESELFNSLVDDVAAGLL